VRKQFHDLAEKGRVLEGKFATKRGDLYGAFQITRPDCLLQVMACDATHGTDGFEHVSVSLPDRTPTWEEMCFIKGLFWDDEETVIQYHPPKSKYVNVHHFVLHMWRYTMFEMPLPPRECV
jgi:hypothetical protein